MAISLVVPGVDPRTRLRVEVDLGDGRATVWNGQSSIGFAWFCPPNRWERVEPDSPSVNCALLHAGRVLETLAIEPMEVHPSCEDENRCDLAG